ncbi:hypothetical protein CEP53_010354 [Fusarium sp. AF-6]|nr:hypothetical protein CEP53_010354 [Fusarium sp. AF-6]
MAQVESGGRATHRHTGREPPPSLGEMVVPQAKTLGTHKIYFDPSPPFEADGDKQLNTHAYLTGTPPNPRPLASPGIFACNTRFFPSESVSADEHCCSFDRVSPDPPHRNSPIMSDVQERLKKLGLGARTGTGKGTPRRKVKRAPARSGADDKKLQQTLKKLNTQPIQAIEEVNMFKSDGNVIHFAAPKVHAAVPSNTFAIYGNGEDKELTELVPGILNQLGPDSLASLRKLAESYQNMQKEKGEDEDDIPDLVEGENFESKVE